jgi:hypothetical protein
MMRGLAGAAGIVVVTNVLALAGAAYNRSVVVERVELSEAELTSYYSSSGEGPTSVRLSYLSGSDYSAPPFSEAQLKAVGFDLPAIDPANSQDRTVLPRDVVVALDLDGPARQRWLDQFYAHATGEMKPPETRLVVVDIGHDLASMRAAHPDASHTIVLYGVIQPRPVVGKDGQWSWNGYLQTLLPGAIHVPLDLRLPFTTRKPPDISPRYSVTLCVGRRGEPWIESVRSR